MDVVGTHQNCWNVAIEPSSSVPESVVFSAVVIPWLILADVARPDELVGLMVRFCPDFFFDE